MTRGRSVAWGIVAPLAALLAACAAPDPQSMVRHVGPSGELSARLVMRGAVQAGQSYQVFVLDDTEHCLTPRLAGTGGASRNPTSTRLMAYQPATLEFLLTTSTGQVCSVIWTFTPQAGKSYLLNGASQRDGCAARLMDMSDPDDMQPVTTALRRNPAGQRCLPVLQSLRPDAAVESGAFGADAVLRPGAKDDDLKGLIKP